MNLLTILDLDILYPGYYQNEKTIHPGGKPASTSDATDQAGEEDPMLDTSTTPLHISGSGNNIHHNNNNNKKQRGQYTNQMSSGKPSVFSWPSPDPSPQAPQFAVENPDYFEDEFQAAVANTDDVDDDDDVWEVQEPVPNGNWKGYLPVANSCNSPSHNAHPVNTKVMYNPGRALRNSESNV